jgi:hypothetical protein
MFSVKTVSAVIKISVIKAGGVRSMSLA